MNENPLSGENVNSIVTRAKAILLKPAEEWPRIAGETQSSSAIFIKYVVPLAAIGPICSLIGGQLFGYGAFGFSYRPGLMGALSIAIIGYVLALVGVVVLSKIAGFLAPKFDGEDTGNSSLKLVAYSMTAGWLAGIFGLIPSLGFLELLGLYSFYLFYVGSGPVMKVPQEKRLSYTAVTVVCAIILYLVVGAVSGAVMGMFGRGPMDMVSDGNHSGSMNIPGVGSIDVGKAEDAAERMEKMARGEIKPITPAELQALIPASIGSYTRVANQTTAMGTMGSEAEATFESGDNRFDLKVRDISALGGLAGIAGAMNIEQTREDDDGFERVHKVGGQMVTEKWRNSSNRGSYGVMVADRFMIEAEGTAENIDVLKAAVATIDQGDLASLAKD